MIHISTTNSKLGLIPSVSLLPILTCRHGCPCSNDCYARKGRYRFQNVKSKMRDNYLLYMNNPIGYFAQIKNFICGGIVSYSYFRWHAAGDIVDTKYLKRMASLANDLPSTKFLCFTKKFELVNDYVSENGSLPANLIVVFSAWGKDFQIQNPHNFPVAHVRFKDLETEEIPDEAIECSGSCTTCLKCWNIQHGQHVVFNKH